jgi:broad specificity phosphatase PhoE
VSEPTQRVVLVRHGETAWTISGQHTGHQDIPLTAAGRRQARRLRARLRGQPFALVLTSPLSRAAETAGLAGFPDARPDDDLREWEYGAYGGRTTADIRRERPGWSLWDDGVPDGESDAQVAARADRVIARARAADGDVLLFGHGHHLRVLAARWLGRPPAEGRLFALGAASLSVLGYEREQPVIVRWNETFTAA